MKYTKKFLTQEVIDVTTGELLRVNQLTISKKEYDLYMKMYLAHIEKLMEISPSEMSLLTFIAETLKINSSRIYISTALIKEFAEKAKVSDSTGHRALKGLRDKMFIISTSSGKEYLNPVYIWNGYEDKRIDEIKFIKDLFENDN